MQILRYFYVPPQRRKQSARTWARSITGDANRATMWLNLWNVYVRKSCFCIRKSFSFFFPTSSTSYVKIANRCLHLNEKRTENEGKKRKSDTYRDFFESFAKSDRTFLFYGFRLRRETSSTSEFFYLFLKSKGKKKEMKAEKHEKRKCCERIFGSLRRKIRLSELRDGLRCVGGIWSAVRGERGKICWM